MARSDTDLIVRTTGLHADEGSVAAERAHQRQRVAALETELAERTAELEKVREEWNATREELASARTELASIRAQLEDRERELQKTREWADFLEADLKRQREIVDELKDRMQTLESGGLLGRLRAWL